MLRVDARGGGGGGGPSRRESSGANNAEGIKKNNARTWRRLDARRDAQCVEMGKLDVEGGRAQQTTRGRVPSRRESSVANNAEDI